MRYAMDDERSRVRESVSANPYLLDVFTSSVRDVVADAGGWIVDRVLAGWTVTVITDAEDEGRVAQILGTKVVVRSEIAGQARPQPYGIALTSTLYGTDRRLRKCVSDALSSRRTEISIIGCESEGEWDPRLHPVAYRLSDAAQAFKMHALAAAGLPYSSVGGTEQFLGAALPARGQTSAGKRRDRRRSRGNERTLLPDCERTASSS